MYGRSGLDRFKKAQTLEPFSVTTVDSASKTVSQQVTKAAAQPLVPPSQLQTQHQHQPNSVQRPVGQDAVTLVAQSQVGGGQSTWQPPDWAVEPRPGVYYLQVLKGHEVIDRINLDRRRHIFGRQFHTCDFVLDHQSVSRQHAAVVPHKNGSIYVIDLGSAHGTFVANERLTKDTPVELEVGQSLRFAASTRSYILRKNDASLLPPPLPPSPDPSDEEAVLAYNTYLNRYGLTKSGQLSEFHESGSSSGTKDDSQQSERAAKRIRKMRVTFRDQVGGELVEVVGISDGADVETEPGPVGVKEGSLVGKYESLVQVTVIPKGKEQFSAKEKTISPKGVTDRLQQVFSRVKTTPKGGMYDDLYGESFSGKVGSSWALPSASSDVKLQSPSKDVQGKFVDLHSKNPGSNSSRVTDDDDDDDLFGD